MSQQPAHALIGIPDSDQPPGPEAERVQCHQCGTQMWLTLAHLKAATELLLQCTPYTVLCQTCGGQQ